MTGKQLQDAIVELAHRLGYRAAHFSPTQRGDRHFTAYAYDGKGFPDLVLVGPRIVFAEVKGDGDVLRPDQDAWLAALQDARCQGVVVAVFAPRDWRSGAVEAVLRDS